jgi:AraC-like DNA-binding protein
VIYKEITPGPALRLHVECFWTLRGTPANSAGFERILPDGCPELILNLADRFVELREPFVRERQPQFFVVGQMERPMWIAPTGAVDLVGVRFHSWGAASLLGLPARELTGRVVELGGISGALERAVLRELVAAGTERERIAALEAFLARLSSRGEPIDPRVVTAGAEAVRSGGSVAVSTLADQAGLSTRQLERLFDAHVGLSPKQLCSLLRFQQIFRAMDQDEEESWASVALRCGYFDQAHLIRDFRRYTGATPAKIGALPELTENFLRKNRIAAQA